MSNIQNLYAVYSDTREQIESFTAETDPVLMKEVFRVHESVRGLLKYHNITQDFPKEKMNLWDNPKDYIPDIAIVYEVWVNS